MRCKQTGPRIFVSYTRELQINPTLKSAKKNIAVVSIELSWHKINRSVARGYRKSTSERNFSIDD